ncbi:hypothetical protein WMY93_026019 [Mugilogobius chulae]|uniref:RRM domain-containing protein n=1 Tax=Mugilogobius chulae TaxID=88201 RepID=A0AAW0N777_9GOBI
MAVVIRLQGLSMAAGSQDIRQFFSGLRIPDGGVHIVGGELDEAFIIFGSDEDARIAMTKSGNYIKDSPVKLLLSSKTEMQNVLERSSSGFEKERQLMLRGMPFSVTEKDIRKFFEGLVVEKVIIMQNNQGQNNGNGLVTFGSIEDATHGLKRHKEYIGKRFIEVYTLKQWENCFGERQLVVSDVSGRRQQQRQSPPRRQGTSQYHARSRSPLGRGPSSSNGDEYCVLLDNLSHAAEKHDIMTFFNQARLGSDQILYLLDRNGSRSRRAFVLFNSLVDYRDALDRDQCTMMNRNISVCPISREKMRRLLEDQKFSSFGEKKHIHVKALPFDVRKVEIIDFFYAFNVAEDSIIVLRDHKGNGLGEAIISFQTEAEAMDALSLNEKRFLGSEVRLRVISQTEMEDMNKQSFAPRSSSRDNRNFEASYAPDRDFPPKRPPRDDYAPDRDFPPKRPPRDEYAPDRDFPPKRSPRDDYAPDRDFPPKRPPRDDYAPDRDFPPKRSPRDDRFHASRDFSRGPHNNGRESARGGPWQSGHDDHTCLKLLNLPFNIKVEEVYDFCYGYKIVPGSVSLQYHNNGSSKGTATVVFESRQEALNAIDDLSGRPIGQRKIQLVFL